MRNKYFQWEVFYMATSLVLILKQIESRTIASDTIEKVICFDKLIFNHSLLFPQTINVDRLTEEFTGGLRSFLTSYVGDLQDIRRIAQDSHSNYTYEPDITPFHYYNDKDGNPDSLEIIYSDQFSVNLNRSFVQVPTEIFRSSVQILNDIKWSTTLDEVFVSNYRRNPSLQWQYIGKETGVMRTFPGAK